MNSFKVFMNVNAFVGFSFTVLHFYLKGYKGEEIKNYLVFKKKNEEVFLPPKLMSLFKTVLGEMKFDLQSVIHPFMTTRLDLVHSGFPKLGFKSFVGIPLYFTFSDDPKISIYVVVKNLECTPVSPEAKALDSSFQLSEKAKKFALAREIYDLTHPTFYLLGFLPCAAAGLGNGLLMKVKTKPTGLHVHSPKYFCFLVLTVSYLFYSLVYDIIFIYKKADANYKTAQLGKEYIEGGIEYFEKMLERNKTLRSLNSDYNFTESGDIPSNIYRTNTLKLKTQIKSFKELLKDNKSKNQFNLFFDYLSDNFSLKQ